MILQLSFLGAFFLSNFHLPVDAFIIPAFTDFSGAACARYSFLSNSSPTPGSKKSTSPKIVLSALLPWETEEEMEPSVEIATQLSRDPEKIGKLARLAVAFSPPGQALKLKDLEQVEVVSLDQNHIEIAAIICEDDCVSVLVPINFPHSCGMEGLEECVLHELDELDEAAEIKISNMSSDLDDEYWENTQNSQEYNEYTYPDWWETPNQFSLLHNECKSITNLLNEDDFKEEVKRLVFLEVWESLNGNGLEVHDAFVVEVGLSGLYIRAKAKINGEDDFKIIEVPIAFRGNKASDADSLRAAVLGTVVSSHV